MAKSRLTWPQVAKILNELNQPDPLIFARAGLEMMVPTHRAFPVILDSKPLIVVAEKSLTWKQLKSLSADQALGAVSIFTFDKQYAGRYIGWRKIWPTIEDFKTYKGRDVLLVEDDQDARELYEMALTEAGYRVITADNGRDGLEKCILYPGISVLVTDVRLPETSGIDMIKKLEILQGASFRRIPVLFISGYATHEVIEKAVKLGYTRWLIKPFEMDELVSMVDTLYLSRKAS